MHVCTYTHTHIRTHTPTNAQWVYGNPLHIQSRTFLKIQLAQHRSSQSDTRACCKQDAGGRRKLCLRLMSLHRALQCDVREQRRWRRRRKRRSTVMTTFTVIRGCPPRAYSLIYCCSSPAGGECILW